MYFWILLCFAVLALLLTIVTVRQGTIAVLTIFGKYKRILGPGLSFKIPFFERVHRIVSIQNRSIELDFQAITQRSGERLFQSDAAVFGSRQ